MPCNSMAPINSAVQIFLWKKTTDHVPCERQYLFRLIGGHYFQLVHWVKQKEQCNLSSFYSSFLILKNLRRLLRAPCSLCVCMYIFVCLCLCIPSYLLSPIQPRPVNRCWPSPVQSFFVSSLVGTHNIIYVLSKSVYEYVFQNGVSSLTRGGFVFRSKRHIYWTLFL
jgi:hypothetical protein